MITIGPNSSTVLSFVADQDSQPSAGDYFMYLSHVDIDTNAAKTTVGVGGECEIKMSQDGSHWYSVTCTSKDANEAPYNLSYVFADEPMSVKQF
jgi:hypothetical protein